MLFISHILYFIFHIPNAGKILFFVGRIFAVGEPSGWSAVEQLAAAKGSWRQFGADNIERYDVCTCREFADLGGR
jgi:hypothetical protein